MSEKHIGKVLQVMGPVLDIQFEDGQLPERSTPSRSTTTAKSWWSRWHSTPAITWCAALQ